MWAFDIMWRIGAVGGMALATPTEQGWRRSDISGEENAMRCRLLLGVVTGICLANSPAALAAVAEGPLVNPENRHTYFLLHPGSWTDSEALAVPLSGHLASIRNAQEQSWVFSNFGTYQGVNYSLWIGLYDRSSDLNGLPHVLNFQWVDGEAAPYRDWAAGEPNDGHAVNPAGEFYVHMEKTGNGFGIPPGFWNDMDNNGSYAQFAPYAGVVEVPGVPGDANLDGRVDLADLLTLSQHYGLDRNATWSQGDFNGNGAVNFNDLVLLAQNYGSGAGGKPVPEPVAPALIAVGVAVLARRRSAKGSGCHAAGATRGRNDRADRN
jgi:hypothetical protein